MIREKSGINQKVWEMSGKIAFTLRNLTFTIMTCLMCFDSTTLCDYGLVPYIVVCTAGFLAFKMLVLIWC
jgi:hypothetical protein